MRSETLYVKAITSMLLNSSDSRPSKGKVQDSILKESPSVKQKTNFSGKVRRNVKLKT